MNFKVDENLPDELAQLLSDSGWDCRTVVEQQLGGVDDPTVSKVCDEEDRILVTFDRGFANIKNYPPAHHAGIIVFRLKNQDKLHVLAVSARLVQALRKRTLRNELWIVHENRIRIRLPG